MTEFENKEQEAQTLENTHPTHDSSSTQPDVILMFKNVWEYLLKFIKAPISTMKTEELDPKEAAILLGFLPISLFLSMWSLMRSLVNLMFNAMLGFGGPFGPTPTQMRSEMLAEVSWGSIFFNGLVTSAVWFALIMFAPLGIAKLFKNAQVIDMKKLFSQMAVITIPMTCLYLVATVLGFMTLWLWFVPVAVSLVLPLLLHFVIIRNIFKETPDHALYIAFITQVIIILVAGFWLNIQMNNLFADTIGSFFW